MSSRGAVLVLFFVVALGCCLVRTGPQLLKWICIETTRISRSDGYELVETLRFGKDAGLWHGAYCHVVRGKIQTTGQWDNGTKIGVWTHWNRDGTPRFQRTWKDLYPLEFLDDSPWRQDPIPQRTKALQWIHTQRQ